MTTQANGGTAASAGTVAAPAPAPAAAPALTADDVQRMVSQGVSQAISADRARGAAIRTCEEAKGREKLAAHLAENTNMTADEAKAILSAAPKEAEPAPVPAPGNTRQESSNYFATAMDRTANPNVGADPAEASAAGGGEAEPGAVAGRLAANYAAVTGRKVIGINDRRDAAAA